MPLTSNIAAFYKLDEATAAERVDFFALAPNLVAGGTVTQVSGHIGNAASFNASRLTAIDDAFSLRPSGGDPALGFSKTFTFWVNSTSWASQPGILSNWANSAGPVQWLLYAVDASNLDFQVRDVGGSDHIAHIAAPSTGAYHFITLYYNSSSGELGISIDNGAFVTATTTSVAAGAGSIELANRNNGGAGLVGDIDAFGVWDRVLDAGEITQLYNSGAGVEPPFSSGVLVDNFQIRTGSWNKRRYSASISAKSSSPSSTGYIRQALVTKDDSSSSPEFSLRYDRNYYTLPSSSFWTRYYARLDLTAAKSDVKEDGFRYYAREYKHNQVLFLDGPTVVEGTLLPTSFIHPIEPQAAETFTFSSALNANSFQMEFKWAPTFGCADLISDLEIARVSIDSNNYISLTALAGNSSQREYNEGDVYGPHDPTFILRKVRGGSVTASISIVCYYGYDLAEPSGERLHDVLKFNITHHAGGVLGFRIGRAGVNGEKRSLSDLTAFSGSGTASIVYSGAGCFGPPTLLEEVQTPEGRTVPKGRADALRKSFTLSQEAVGAGDRDPTAGQLILNTPYLSGDTFDRVDDANLGDDWNVIKQTGNGFNIISNKADCVQEGFEYWIRRPQHADVIVSADVVVSNTNDIVGVLGRLDKDRPDVTAYGAELIQTGASAASVRVVIWFAGVRTILGTTSLSSYTSGATYGLKLTLLGTSVTATATSSGVTVGEATATHDILKKPGRVGIYGVTGGSGQHVTVDNFLVTQNFPVSV